MLIGTRNIKNLLFQQGLEEDKTNSTSVRIHMEEDLVRRIIFQGKVAIIRHYQLPNLIAE
jgi:hypothetical protein